MEQFRVHGKNALLTDAVSSLILLPKYPRIKGEKMGTGYAKIRVTDEVVLVRFDGVSSDVPYAFEALRDRFYARFPSARWNWSLRRMVLPRNEFDRAIKFGQEEFGPNGVIIEYQTSQRWIGFSPSV